MNSKMKMLGLAVLLLILFSLTFTAVAYSPYRADTLYPRYSEFEGMSEEEVQESLPKREDFLGINLSTSGFSSTPAADNLPKRDNFLGINLSNSGFSSTPAANSLPKREDFLGINLSNSGFSSTPAANSLPKRDNFLGINLSNSGFSSIPVAEGFDQYTPMPQIQQKPVKVEGFESLLQPANYGQDQSISKFSELKGNLSCIHKSAGLSNSMGGLCIDGELLKSLTTRGGNSTGANCPKV